MSELQVFDARSIRAQVPKSQFRTLCELVGILVHDYGYRLVLTAMATYALEHCHHAVAEHVDNCATDLPTPTWTSPIRAFMRDRSGSLNVGAFTDLMAIGSALIAGAICWLLFAGWNAERQSRRTRELVDAANSCIRSKRHNVLEDRRGVVAIEFALIVSIVGLAVFVGMSQVAPGFDTWAQHLAQSVADGRAVLAQLQAQQVA